jgi:hypothetical protein
MSPRAVWSKDVWFLLPPIAHGGVGFQLLLERMIKVFPSDRWLVIEDNLSIYTSQETKLALAAWPQIQLLPKYAPWSNSNAMVN